MLFLIVIVFDENDSFRFIGIFYSVLFDEDVFIGIIVLQVFVIDEDLFDSLIYILFGINSLDFSIVLSFGVIMIVVNFDYEFINLYFLIVVVLDGIDLIF